MGRRCFLAGSLKVGVSALASTALPLYSSLASAAGGTTLAVATGRNYRNVVIDAVDMLGGLGSFVSSGERVAIKPNIGWDRTPELAANTHPIVVKTIAEMCLDAGAKRITVLDRTCDDARRTYVNSGIKSAVEEIKDSRVRVEYVNMERFVKIKIPRGIKLEDLEVYRTVLDADKLINVPVAKSHGLTTLTLSMKNLMGVIGGRRGMIHWEIDQKLADISTVIRPDLIVLDATRILTRGGPSGGNIKNVKVLNKVIAGTDPVAIDSYGATLFGIKGTDIGHIATAYKMGLGEINLSKVTVKGV
ncbi:MAG: DUF362 domain-containing protein [Deltaproteobacteria bacterium]|uniref:DUF362 domain-containing protein n=1 Tax=Candidatus Zymogenus saltonus TaxID=2844893 RepID=A0A9D8KED6_9DELT|nr:DUF362 domain-containing protein [Candidatus Zymogenus saltonus]